MMLKLATTALFLGLPITVTAANTDLKRTVGATTTTTGGLRRGLTHEEEEEEYYDEEPMPDDYDEMHPDTSAYCWEEHVGYIVTGMSDHYETDTHVKGMEGTDYHLYMYEDRKLGYEKPSYEEGSSSSSSGGSHNGYYEYHYGYKYEYSYGDDNGHMPYPPPSDVDTTGAWCREACEKEDWCMAYEYWAYGPHGARCELWTHWTGYTDHYSGFVSYVKVSCGSSSSTGDGYGYKEEEDDEDEESSHDYDDDDSNYDDDTNHDDDSGR
jgi:hypothetical protein